MSSSYPRNSRFLVWVCVCTVLAGTAASLLAQGGAGAPPAPAGGQAPPAAPPAGGRGGGRGGGPAAPLPTGRPGAGFDPTGYWVSLVTEDWRHRIITPVKGDYGGVPINQAARAKADMWDPAKDEAAGEQCRGYGAVGILRLPTRLHVTWQDDMTLKIETDTGTQTRLVHFGPTAQAQGGDWQGVSVGSWDYPAAAFGGRGGRGRPPGAALKVVTTKMKPGYIRKNGVPYGANAVLTEYIDRFDIPGSDSYMMFKQELVDPENLANPAWVSWNFKKQNDATGWNPTPCSAR